MSLKIKFDEDIFELKSSPTLLTKMIFWKTWTYNFEMPISRIKKINIRKRSMVNTAYIYVKTSRGSKRIPFCVDGANHKQVLKLYNFSQGLVA